MFGGDSTHMPLKVNTSGVIPPIFASSLLLIPATIAGFTQSAGAGLAAIHRAPARSRPGGLYGPVRRSDHLLLPISTPRLCSTRRRRRRISRNMAGSFPASAPAPTPRNISTGADPADHDRRGLSVRRLPAAGILLSNYTLPFYLGGTSLLIIVSVTMDTVAQIQSHLLAHQYEGLIRKNRGKRPQIRK